MEKTPLSVAVCEEHEQIVQILLEKGANVNSQEKVFFFFVGLVKLFFLFFFLSKGGFTPLYIAAENEYEQIVQILLEKGKPNVDLADQVLICWLFSFPFLVSHFFNLFNFYWI